MGLNLFKKGNPKIEPVKPVKEQKVEEKSSEGNQELEIKVDLLREELNVIKEKEKVVDERISRINESIGEIREMGLTTEKDSKELGIRAEEAISIIKETKPEKINERLEKFDAKIEKQNAILESYKALIEAIQEKQKEINQKMSIFKGAETLLDLNKEIREELMNIKKIEAKIERDADRVESIYITYQKEFSELREIKSNEDDIEKLQKEMVKEIDEMKIKMSALVEKKFFENLKEEVSKTTQKIDNIRKMADDVKKNKEKVDTLIKNFESRHVDPEELLKKVDEFNKKLREFESRPQPVAEPGPVLEEGPEEEPRVVSRVVLKPLKERGTSIFDEVIAERRGETDPDKERMDTLERAEMEIENSISLIGENRNKTAVPFLMKIEKDMYDLSKRGVLTPNMIYAVLNELKKLIRTYGPQSPVAAEISASVGRINKYYNQNK